MAPTMEQAVQNEKNQLLAQIRHMANLCTCPGYITIAELNSILGILKGEK